MLLRAEKFISQDDVLMKALSEQEMKELTVRQLISKIVNECYSKGLMKVEICDGVHDAFGPSIRISTSLDVCNPDDLKGESVMKKNNFNSYIIQDPISCWSAFNLPNGTVESCVSRTQKVCIKKHVAQPAKMWTTKNGVVTVEFEDRTKVTVKPDNSENADEFMGFCIAIAKKMFGSTTNIEKAMDACKHKAYEKYFNKKKENEDKKRKQKEFAETCRRVRECKISEEIERIKIQEEAQKRLKKEEADTNEVKKEN